MTFKTLIATAAVALAFAPSASARPIADPAPAVPASAQQAKWRAYDEGVRAAYAAAPAPRAIAPVATTHDTIPTAGRIVIAMMIMSAAAGIFYIRRRDAMRTATAGGWDM